MTILYNKDSIIANLTAIFSRFFPMVTKPTKKLLNQLLLACLEEEGLPSVRKLYRNFLSKAFGNSLNSYYHALANPSISIVRMHKEMVRLACQLITTALCREPVFLSLDDTVVPKFGKHFEAVSFLFDHAQHNGHRTVNGHNFVSMTICIPVLLKCNGHQSRIRYVPIPLGYSMWTKECTKLELAGQFLDDVMPLLKGRKVVLSFDSWYASKLFLQHALAFENLDLIFSVHKNYAMYEVPLPKTKKRGRPKVYGDKISLDDFQPSAQIKGYGVAHRVIRSKLLGSRNIHAYVTVSSNGSKRLYFSTVEPMDLHMSCAWQESDWLRNVSSKEMEFYPLKLYRLRWAIETGYYEQKSFWSLKDYRVRSKTAIEHMVNLVNLAHGIMRILPYLETQFQDWQDESSQELRHEIHLQISQQVILSRLTRRAKQSKNPKQTAAVLNWLIKEKLLAA